MTTVVLCVVVALAHATARAEETNQPSPPQQAAPASDQASAPAAPMNPAAREHYERGLERYAARDFAAAVRELEQGFAIDPRREFLFAQAQALRLAGDCPRAMPIYRRFLQSEPSALQAEAAQLGLARCATERSTAPGPTPAPPTPSALPGAGPPSAELGPDAGPAASEAAAADRAPWWRDGWAALALGTGVAALGVAAGFEIASARARADAAEERMGAYLRYAALWETAQSHREVAVASLAVGAALVAVGGARLFWLHRQERAAAAPGGRGRLSLVAIPGAAGVWWEAAF